MGRKSKDINLIDTLKEFLMPTSDNFTTGENDVFVGIRVVTNEFAQNASNSKPMHFYLVFRIVTNDITTKNSNSTF